MLYYMMLLFAILVFLLMTMVTKLVIEPTILFYMMIPFAFLMFLIVTLKLVTVLAVSIIVSFTFIAVPIRIGLIVIPVVMFFVVLWFSVMTVRAVPRV